MNNHLKVGLILLTTLWGTLFAQDLPTKYEGMWLPLYLDSLNYEEMTAQGLELTADEVYNEEVASLEDAILRLDGGSCTGELISGKGLVLTNHHCAYDYIASLSSVSSDFLTNGFWAENHAAELPIEGAFISFLVHSENVTQQVLGQVGENPMMAEEIMEEIAAEYVKDSNLEAEVKEMFHGSEYYLMVYETFRDIRLVGAPPEAIGKFGYDQDNWMWPRHTGDFALLRIYADENNGPAEYAESNQPYKPKKFLPISIKGVEENDYAMIMGYPGSTTRYLTSHAIELAVKQTNPDRIHLREQRTDIMKQAMDQDEEVRLKLASEYSRIMNYYKYFIGQTTMLERYDIIEKRQSEEDAFQEWAESDPDRQAKYAGVLGEIEELFDLYVATDKFWTYLLENSLAPQSSVFAYQTLGELRAALESGEQEAIDEAVASARKNIDEHFKSFVPEVDEAIFEAMFTSYYSDMPEGLHPATFEEIMNPAPPAPPIVEEMPEEDKKKKKKKRKKKKKKKAQEELTPIIVDEALAMEMSPEEKIIQFTEEAYATSLATDRARMEAFLENPTLDAIKDDKVLMYIGGILGFYQEKVAISKWSFEYQINTLRQTYLQGMREMHADKTFYPDANSTMRLTYGRVKSYEPKDAVEYEFYTTTDGIMEKEDPEDKDYYVPARLKELIEKQDFGDYAAEGEPLNVCFLTTNDITGGNSGSPVINGKGELIGTAFDGNWESMAGDIYIFPHLSRTICVDARYILFVIDKYAGATHLLEEMDIRR
ncbi:MAG: S46 family peptidase [Bacteroidota bacterium]